ncbi:FitA-like ribbon-helix-helix domain-containing protein [Muricoccus aerilatus]|uniref:FitA-like ribbon-helix-helix domain-containing protein n=1 Tax=Muricoccus aerilatus TaxID=452982 RepID=UPI0038CD8258
MKHLVLDDPPHSLVEALEPKAALNGRSVEAEHRAILEQVLGGPKSTFQETARQLRESTGKIGTESGEIVREQRDARHGRFG